MQPVGFSVAPHQQLVAVVAEDFEVGGRAGLAGWREVAVAGSDAGDGQGVGGVGLARAAQPPALPDRQRTGHLAHLNTLVVQEAGQGST